MMENLLDKLNSLKSPSNFVKMDLIPSDVKLPVFDIGRLDTRYGPSVFISLQLPDDIVKVFLPKRFSELSDEELESMRHMTGLVLQKSNGDGRSPIIVFSKLDI